MTDVRIFEMDFAGRNLKVEIGEVAKQAAGAAIVRYNDTALLSVVAVSKKPVSTGAPIKASKSSNSRKVAPVKTGSSRGK